MTDKCDTCDKKELCQIFVDEGFPDISCESVENLVKEYKSHKAQAPAEYADKDGSVFDNYPAVRYVDEFERDTDPLCIKCKGNCGFIGIVGYWACQGFVPMTNRDKLSNMSNKKLAEWFQTVCTASSECSCCDCKFSTLDECTFEEWLGQEVE